jgi:repressor LexA
MAKRIMKSTLPKNPDQKRRPGRPPVEGPTARQQAVLDFVRDTIQANRRPPTIEEIRRHFKYRSPFVVREHIAALEKKGLLHVAKRSSRGLSLPEDDDTPERKTRLVPVLGDAAAGSPIEAIEQHGEHIALDEGMFPAPGMFAVRVRGDSMIDAGINDHDVALIQPTTEAREDDLILARLHNEVTIKRLRFTKGKPRLHPENARYDDIIPEEGDDFAIIGTVAGIIRKY